MMTQEQMEQKLIEKDRMMTTIIDRLTAIENILYAARVNIKNFEGVLKVGTTAPTTTDAQEGSLRLTNESGTYKLYARINQGWRSVTLT